MTSSLILITNPSNPLLDEETTAKVQALLPNAKADILSKGTALVWNGMIAPDNFHAVKATLQGLEIDVAFLPNGVRKMHFLIADMDSTMIDQECIDELAGEVGLKDKVSGITARAMNGEIAFEPALRERVALLEGLPTSVIEKVISKRITLASGGPTLLATMKKNGAFTALVSGGFTSFTRPIAEKLGFDENRANILIEKDGHLTGMVAEPILGKQAKVDALLHFCKEKGLKPEETIAVGDGANDLAMLDVAGLGVALHAKPSVADQADIRIDYGDLTALLFLQGYKADEFITPAH